MRILLYHPVRLPPRDYGGVERVVLWLAEALRDLGQDVSIAAAPGSLLPPGVKLLPVSPGESVESALGGRSFDIVHFHSPPPASRRLDFPHVVTIHGNGKPGESFLPNTLFLSADHARRHGRKSYVHNGVNPGEFRFLPRKPRGARPLFLSKTSWKVKNLDGAMRFARQADTGLVIAGGYRPIHLLLKSAFWGFDWAGPVAGETKAALLTEASCLLFPIRWPEPFGLVMVEAMMSGTPVIASRLGSVPEVLGAWGGVSLDLDDTAGWVNAIQNVRRFDASAVRDAALERFTHWRMAEGYLEYYRKAIHGESFE